MNEVSLSSIIGEDLNVCKAIQGMQLIWSWDICVFTWAWSNAPFVSLYLKAASGFAASFVIVFPFWNGINGMVSCYYYNYLPLLPILCATDMITNKIFHNTHTSMRKENGKPHKIRRRIPLCLLFSMTDEMANNMYDFQGCYRRIFIGVSDLKMFLNMLN